MANLAAKHTTNKALAQGCVDIEQNLDQLDAALKRIEAESEGDPNASTTLDEVGKASFNARQIREAIESLAGLKDKIDEI